MKQILFSAFLLTVGLVFGQEKISALRTNPSIYTEQAPLTRASEMNDLDSTFQYEFGNIDLQYVWDDFSINKIEQFKANFDEPGVTSELFYHLMDVTNTFPQDPDLVFCDSLYAHHDTVKIEAGIEVEVARHYPFTPFDIWVNDLDFYPVEGELVENVFQECYVLIDSLVDGVLDPDQDTVWFNQPFGSAYVQDSARVFTKMVTDTNVLWVDNFACHNYTFAYRPWSLGVATLDGVDQNGRPYEFGNEAAYGIADYLTTRSINLAGESNVYLTFLYQAEGFGNMPEPTDSLILEFWDQSEQTWYKMWNNPPDFVADDWDTVHIAVPISMLENGFRFRFYNYASLSGALDHWHLDYVSLKADAFPTVDNFSDLAISYPVVTLLKDYTAVPWDHYVATTGSEKMLEKSDLYMYNSNLVSINFSPGAFSIRKEGVLQGGSPYVIPSKGVGDPNYLVGFNECLFDVASNYAYNQGAGGVQAAFDVEVNIASATAAPNKHRVNDTTRFTQRFDNYYAYDDGSAEAAYGIEGVGSLMAYKFEAYQPGELTGILMQFVPTVTDLSGEVFLLTVWADNAGEPGQILYQDDYFESHSPEYSGSKTGFRYYTFTNDDSLNADGYLPVGEVFYVGWQNISSASLNIGLDWNRTNGDKVFRNTAGSWITSSFDMSLLIRPVFSTGLDYTLSNGRDPQLKEQSKAEIKLYPNPANTQFALSGLPDDFNITVYDLSGRTVINANNESNIDISFLENGAYIVTVQSPSGENIYTAKLIKK